MTMMKREVAMWGLFFLAVWILRSVFMFNITRVALSFYGGHLNILYKILEQRISFSSNKKSNFWHRFLSTMGWSLVGALVTPIMQLQVPDKERLASRFIFFLLAYVAVNWLPDSLFN